MSSSLGSVVYISELVLIMRAIRYRRPAMEAISSQEGLLLTEQVIGMYISLRPIHMAAHFGLKPTGEIGGIGVIQLSKPVMVDIL